MSGVDDLFGGGRPSQTTPPRDLVPQIGLWLGIAGVLNLLGVTCFTGVPGAALTIWCWHLCEEELQRVETGITAPERGPALRRLRSGSFAMLIFAMASLALQAFLFWIGFYQTAADIVLSLFGSLETPL